MKISRLIALAATAALAATFGPSAHAQSGTVEPNIIWGTRDSGATPHIIWGTRDEVAVPNIIWGTRDEVVVPNIIWGTREETVVPNIIWGTRIVSAVIGNPFVYASGTSSGRERFRPSRSPLGQIAKARR